MRYWPILLPAVCLCVQAWAAGEEASAENEKLLGQFASAFEDAVTALSSVQSKTEADVVASRVAVDFILLQRLNREVLRINPNAVSPSFAREFTERSTKAQQQVQAAAERLSSVRCFESKALEAALSFASLVSGQLEDHAALQACRELVLNNLELSNRLLKEIRDYDSAEKIAPMLKVVLSCGRIINEFRGGLESRGQALPPEHDFDRRLQRFREESAKNLERLQLEGFFDNRALREVLQADSQ